MVQTTYEGPKSNLKKIAWLEKGLEISKSVCKLKNSGLGTGFLVKGGWLITNNHVIPTREEADITEAQFNFNEDMSGKLLQYHSYRLDTSTFFTNKELDITRIKILENSSALSTETWNYLDFSDTTPLPGDHVTIIQHPAGGPKQIALNENRVTNIFRNYLQYTTDTLPGSSGSPVFNDDWKIVGIHHRGGNLVTNDKGDKRFINQAVLVSKILEIL
ncbi:MAG: trypsin-like peptidase domain-containing protein [Desulfobacteraceae bacterium]|nr:trypsin-like peptidase domain-containing protein [Desulfobacteraceae bacterium]